MKIYALLSYSAVFAIVIPLSIGLWRFRRLDDKLKLLTGLLCIGAVTELVANILAEFRINNLPILHFYSIAEFALLFTIYHLYFRNIISRRTYLLGLSGFVVFALINAFYIQDLYGFNTYPLLVESTIFTGLSLLFFYKTLQEKKVVHIEQTSMFWLSSGHLIYFAGNLSIFTFSNYMLEVSNQLHEGIWAIHSIFLIILYIAYSIALRCP